MSSTGISAFAYPSSWRHLVWRPICSGRAWRATTMACIDQLEPTTVGRDRRRLGEGCSES